MYNQKNIQKAMRITLDNARRFFEDSKILGQEGSMGHATSLAILGFEEAHKAYLLSQFLSIFDEIYTEQYREELEQKLCDHEWKQSYAKEFRVGLEVLLESMSEVERNELGLTTHEELRKGTEIAFLENPNDLKNAGFYSDPFTSPVWNPSDMKKKTWNAMLKLLRTHINSVEQTVHWLSWLSALPRQFRKYVRERMVEIWANLLDVKGLDELQKQLTEYEEAGDYLFKLVKAALTDERINEIRQDREQLRKYRKKS
ncbi:MAG: AbiV family abortive infection protein [Candidatus Thorarchaeota archaeon]|jgi:AbiV family abortive infection protein